MRNREGWDEEEEEKKAGNREKFPECQDRAYLRSQSSLFGPRS